MMPRAWFSPCPSDFYKRPGILQANKNFFQIFHISPRLFNQFPLPHIRCIWRPNTRFHSSTIGNLVHLSFIAVILSLIAVHTGYKWNRVFQRAPMPDVNRTVHCKHSLRTRCLVRTVASLLAVRSCTAAPHAGQSDSGCTAHPRLRPSGQIGKRLAMLSAWLSVMVVAVLA